LGRSLFLSCGRGFTFPAFAEPLVTHQVIGEVSEADLELVGDEADGIDVFSADAVLPENQDVSDAGAHLGVLTVGRVLLGA
jgi:hypothetical protein